MKNNKLIILLSLALLVIAVSCNEEDFVVYGTEESIKVTDPYLQVLTPVISFQAGTPSYLMEIQVVNTDQSSRISAVDVYKVFTDIVTGNSSNEALLGSYPLGTGTTTLIHDELTYADLKEGLTVNGGPLPDDETELALGSGWSLRFVGKGANGDVPMNGSIQISVLSRFAGLYRVIESTYWRIGVVTATWTGQDRFIGSVDETTFSYNDYWGNFAWDGNSFNFTISEVDNSINVPILVNGALFGGHRELNCNVEPETFGYAPCVGSNILIPDDLNGKHVIKLTYGYYTNGSGSREFYEVLEKL